MLISGTWMDFQHQNKHDGLYWNDAARQFSCDQWRLHIREMATLGIDTIVLMSSALDDAAFYPNSFMEAQWKLECSDPIEAVLLEADALNIKVFVSAGFYGHTTEETSDAPDYFEWHQKLADDLWMRYGGHRSFYGWYIPNEAEIDGCFSTGYMNFLPAFSHHLRTIHPGVKILIAPYGTNKVVENSKFVDQIHMLGVDFIAYQDEIGVRKSRVDDLPDIFERLHRLHHAAGHFARPPARL